MHKLIEDFTQGHKPDLQYLIFEFCEFLNIWPESFWSQRHVCGL